MGNGVPAFIEPLLRALAMSATEGLTAERTTTSLYAYLQPCLRPWLDEVLRPSLHDSDNDGTPDFVAPFFACLDLHFQGWLSTVAGSLPVGAEDTLGDFSASRLTDARDGISEWLTLTGITELVDTNHNGLPDYIEYDLSLAGDPTVIDWNGNGIPDYAEDDDGDGIPNFLDNDWAPENDADRDGIPDDYDTDDDNDGSLDYGDPDHEGENGTTLELDYVQPSEGPMAGGNEVALYGNFGAIVGAAGDVMFKVTFGGVEAPFSDALYAGGADSAGRQLFVTAPPQDFEETTSVTVRIENVKDPSKFSELTDAYQYNAAPVTDPPLVVHIAFYEDLHSGGDFTRRYQKMTGVDGQFSDSTPRTILGFPTSSAVDSQGTWHMAGERHAYLTGSDVDMVLQVVYWNEAIAEPMVIAQSPIITEDMRFMLRPPHIAVGPHNEIHIAYLERGETYEFTNGPITATFFRESWKHVTVSSGTPSEPVAIFGDSLLPFLPNLALDSHGKWHAVYYYLSSIWYKSPSMTEAAILVQAEAGRSLSGDPEEPKIAVSGTDEVHIMYLQQSSATDTEGVWRHVVGGIDGFSEPTDIAAAEWSDDAATGVDFDFAVDGQGDWHAVYCGWNGWHFEEPTGEEETNNSQTTAWIMYQNASMDAPVEIAWREGTDSRVREIRIALQFTPVSTHSLPVEGDSDGDYLVDAEEASLGYDPTNPDEDGNDVPDGVDLALALSAEIAALEQYGDWQPDLDYVHAVKVIPDTDGICQWACPVGDAQMECGQLVIVNSQAHWTEGHGLYLADMALHYLAQGSFTTGFEIAAQEWPGPQPPRINVLGLVEMLRTTVAKDITAEE